MTTMAVRSLHVGLVAWKLPTPVDAVNVGQASRKHITSLLDSALDANGSARPRLPGLLEIAGYVPHSVAGFCDASLDLPWLAEAVAPTSTITAAALIHAAWAGAAELAAAGQAPEVRGSANWSPSTPNPRSS
jgi:uncharacterized phosphosugar-binding protein